MLRGGDGLRRDGRGESGGLHRDGEFESADVCSVVPTVGVADVSAVNGVGDVGADGDCGRRRRRSDHYGGPDGACPSAHIHHVSPFQRRRAQPYGTRCGSNGAAERFVATVPTVEYAVPADSAAGLQYLRTLRADAGPNHSDHTTAFAGAVGGTDSACDQCRADEDADGDSISGGLCSTDYCALRPSNGDSHRYTVRYTVRNAVSSPLHSSVGSANERHRRSNGRSNDRPDAAARRHEPSVRVPNGVTHSPNRFPNVGAHYHGADCDAVCDAVCFAYGGPIGRVDASADRCLHHSPYFRRFACSYACWFTSADGDTKPSAYGGSHSDDSCSVADANRRTDDLDAHLDALCTSDDGAHR